MNNNKRGITILNKVEFPKNLEYICQNFFFFSPLFCLIATKTWNHRPVLELNILWWLQLNILLSRQQIVYPKVEWATPLLSLSLSWFPLFILSVSSPGACLMQTRTNLGPTIYQRFPLLSLDFSPLFPFSRAFSLAFFCLLATTILDALFLS